MSLRNINPSPQRARSALDHRVIGMAGHFLVVDIWLERQFGSVPKVLTALAAESGTSGSATKAASFSL